MCSFIGFFMVISIEMAEWKTKKKKNKLLMKYELLNGMQRGNEIKCELKIK